MDMYFVDKYGRPMAWKLRVGSAKLQQNAATIGRCGACVNL